MLAPRHPSPVRCSFAGVWAWVDWAELPVHRFYFSAGDPAFHPRRGDLVIFDDLLGQGLCDYMGVVLRARGKTLLTAEGCVESKSGIFERLRDRTIRGYIRIPEQIDGAASIRCGR